MVGPAAKREGVAHQQPELGLSEWGAGRGPVSVCGTPSNLHITPVVRRSRLRRKRGFTHSLAFDHHAPDHSRDLMGERDSSNLRRPPRHAADTDDPYR